MVHEIAAALLPVFFVVAPGYGAGRGKFTGSRNVSALSQLVMVFAIPASLLVSIAARQRSAITSPGTHIAVIVIATLLAAAVILWRQRKVSRPDKGPAAAQARTVSATLSRAGSARGTPARPPPPRPALAGLARTPPRNGRRRPGQ